MEIRRHIGRHAWGEMGLAVLVLGATGLIGSAVVARLAREGHEIVAVTRGGPRSAAETVRWLKLDLREMTEAEAWLPHLAGVEAVVNCAGVLQDGLKDSTRAVHIDAPAALFTACERLGVRRVVQVSAMGAERDGVSRFSQTKHEADTDLAGRDLDWVILRPSVVVGRGAYGGSALFRGLAALPLAASPREAGAVQIVQLDQVAETVALMVKPGAPAKVAFDLCSAELLRFEDVVAAYRKWLGWRPARWIGSASLLLRLGFWAGDLAGLLGWRAPVRSTARKELSRGVVGDPAEWMRLTGIAPTSFAAALAGEPVSVQERWFARLFLLKPAVFVILAAFWIVTGAITFGPAWPAAAAQMQAAGWPPAMAAAGALADILIGVMIAVRPWTRAGLWAAMALSALYLLAGSILQPSLWAEPLGPLVKVVPILVLHVIALALLDDR